VGHTDAAPTKLKLDADAGSHLLWPDRADIKNCQIIGRLELHGLPVEPARSPRIKVTYVFDKNTFVIVKARDEISGKEASVTVQVPK
jgi:molecular chaperone DnaK (HSP70)